MRRNSTRRRLWLGSPDSCTPRRPNYHAILHLRDVHAAQSHCERFAGGRFPLMYQVPRMRQASSRDVDLVRRQRRLSSRWCMQLVAAGTSLSFRWSRD
jgi:hypothetical protein